MGRLKKFAKALAGNIRKPVDPEVKASYEEGKREAMLQEARKSGQRDGRRIGANMGKPRKLPSLSVLGKASSKAANAFEYMNTDWFGSETPATVGKAKKRIRKASRKGEKTVLEKLEELDPLKDL